MTTGALRFLMNARVSAIDAGEREADPYSYAAPAPAGR
jgi:hypothetical protein